jgi:protein SCO1
MSIQRLEDSQCTPHAIQSAKMTPQSVNGAMHRKCYRECKCKLRLFLVVLLAPALLETASGASAGGHFQDTPQNQKQKQAAYRTRGERSLPGLLVALSGPPQCARQHGMTNTVKAPDFILINQENQLLDSTRLRGKIVVLNFIFTTCTDVCPIFTANLAQLQRKLNGRYRSDLYFVSVTTDPEVDSAPVLKAYAQRYGVDFTNWSFLTGPEKQLKQVWNGFSVRVMKKARGLVQHTSLTTVIDRRGERRNNYFGEKWRLEDLERDVLTLLHKKT